MPSIGLLYFFQAENGTCSHRAILWGRKDMGHFHNQSADRNSVADRGKKVKVDYIRSFIVYSDVIDPCKAGRAGVSIAPLSIIE